MVASTTERPSEKREALSNVETTVGNGDAENRFDTTVRNGVMENRMNRVYFGAKLIADRVPIFK